MEYRRFWLVILVLGVSFSRASNTLTNYKSGISVFIQGTDEKDYVFERFYHDSLTDDHGVFYIKDTVKIALAHNERNVAKVGTNNTYVIIGINGQDGIPHSGDEGTIRYKVDRDQQWHNEWWPSTAATAHILPAYTAPFSLNGLTYETGVPVVGTTGPKPGIAVSDRDNYYCRGMLDAYRDEWHILTVGDDDSWRGVDDVRGWGSDGKINYFIVNPKTPAIYFTKNTAASQFYTTPAKSYFVPHIFDQTTYVTDDITIYLVNITTNDPVYYRFDSGSFTQYTGPVSSNTLADGEHTLEYYYNSGFHRTRTIVKNPGFPSDNDSFTEGNISGHGCLLWKNDAEFNAIKQRALSTDPARALYKKWYTAWKTDFSVWGNGQNLLATDYGKGLLRDPGNFALTNAFVAMVEGIDNAPTYAQAAKRCLLENRQSIDLVGRELNHDFEVMPSDDMGGVGYYEVNGIYAMAFAYDLLIDKYRSTSYADGITPIEDILIRDYLAKWCVGALMWRGAYCYGGPGELGMAGHAWNAGALIASVAMPSYNTPYYGTSGYDGSAAQYAFTPFPDHPVTWKDAFYLNNCPLYTYPNMQFEFGLAKYHDPYAWNGIDGMIDSTGFGNVGAYYAYHLMGHTFMITSNVMKIKLDHTYRFVELAFKKAIEGTQCYSHSMTRGYYSQFLVINERYPEIAQAALDSVVAHEGVDEWFWLSKIYGMCWYHDDWQNYVSRVNIQPLNKKEPMVSAYPNPAADFMSFSIPVSKTAGAFKVYTSTGAAVASTPIRGNEVDFKYNTSSLGDGLYVYVLDKGAEKITGTFLITR